MNFPENVTPLRDAARESHGLTDLGNARRLVARHGDDIRYCHDWNCWLYFDGTRWKRDDCGEVMRRAKETVGSIYAEAAALSDSTERKALADHARRSESEARLHAMVNLATSEPGIPVTPSELDGDHWALNCLNGTICLRTGKLRAHRREDLLTKIAPVEYDAAARHPIWDKLLATATGGDPELLTYLQRAVGSSLAGEVLYELLFLIFGPPATAKTTFVEAIVAALGDYAARANFETFLVRPAAGGASEDVARLAGARIVTASEVSDGRRLASGLVKALTGGDLLVARFLYGRSFEYRPQFSLWLVANAAPFIDEDDAAMWRRMKRIPFERIIPERERDPSIKATLRDPTKAGAAILAWAVAGCLSWQLKGLHEPDAVRRSTAEYREETSVLGPWLEECCLIDPNARAKAGELYTAFREWCERNGHRPFASRRFAQKLRERSFQDKHSRTGNVWHGLGLLAR